MKPGSPSATDVKTEAKARIDRRLSELEEPHRTAFSCVASTLNTAMLLSSVAFGPDATPDHALTLLDHLLAQADHVEVHGPDYDEESE